MEYRSPLMGNVDSAVDSFVAAVGCSVCIVPVQADLPTYQFLMESKRNNGRIVLTGASGTIGRSLARSLQARGIDVIRLVRRPPTTASEIAWDPAAEHIDAAALAAASPDSVVHLAGETVFGWWSAAKRRRIYDSRVRASATLVKALLALPTPPTAFVSASAVGYYGDCGEHTVGESTTAGSGFLAHVCSDWEQAAERASREGSGIRTSLLRIGVVVSPTGGALAVTRPLFTWGLGGPIAGGRAWVPWISLADTVRAIEHVLATPSLSGPVNIVGPAPVTQAEFARLLAAKLKRPARIAVPRWLVSAAGGEMARETVLKSVRAVPKRLIESGFRFTHATLSEAIDAAFEAGPT